MLIIGVAVFYMCTWSLPFEVDDEDVEDADNSMLIWNILNNVPESIPESLGFPHFLI